MDVSRLSFITLDDELVLARATDDPVGLVAGLGRRTVIDEIQRAPQLMLAIKSRLDRDNSPGQFLLTGSANLRRIPTVSDALPGAVDYLTLWPFTQGELRERREDFLSIRCFAAEPPRIADAPVGRGEYVELLLRGGFPEAQRRTEPHSKAVLRQLRRRRSSSAMSWRPRMCTSRHRSRRCCGWLRQGRAHLLLASIPWGERSGVSGKTAKGYIDVLERLFLGSRASTVACEPGTTAGQGRPSCTSPTPGF